MAEEGKKVEQSPEEKLLAELKGGEGKPLEFKIEETGEVIKGKDMNEVVETLKKMHIDTRKALKETKQEKEALLSSIRPAEPEPAKEGEFSAEKYWEMVNKNDIVGAQSYVLGAMFGMPADEVVETFATTVNDAKFAKDEIVAAKFKMENPDYPASREAADAVADELKRMQEEARREGEPVPRYGIRSLNMAWQSVKQAGRVKPLDTSNRKEEEPGAPPPTLRGGASGSGQTAEQQLAEMIANEPLEKVEEALRRSGRLQ